MRIKFAIAVAVLAAGLTFTGAAQAATVNLALGGTASQSSTEGNYIGGGAYWWSVASLAIDNDTTQPVLGRHAAATGMNSASPSWWMVDLGDTYSLNSIKVWGANGIASWVSPNVSVLDADGSTAWSHDYSTLPESSFRPLPITLPEGTEGRYVKLEVEGWFLQLAEVEVWGQPVSPTPTPLPGGLLLLGSGLAGLLGLKRKRG
jgi:hypothetical protein